MPRVHYIRARKDYPAESIRRGEMHYKWTTRPGGPGSRGIVHRSPRPPQAWELTSSPFLQTAYQIEHALQQFEVDTFDPDSDVSDIVQQIEDLRDEAQSSLDNMPEGLQENSASGQMLQERIDSCEQWIADIENIDFEEWDDLEEDSDRQVLLDDLGQCGFPG